MCVTKSNNRNKTKHSRIARRPTEKQKEFVKEVSNTLDPVGSYMKVYNKSKEQASRVANRAMQAVAIKDLMNSSKMGLSDEFLLGRLKRALMAKKLVWSRTQEDWLEEVDWQTQIKALEIAFRLKGHLNNKAPELDLEQVKEINVTFNLVKARSIDEIAKLTDQTSIAKARPAVVEAPQEGELVDNEQDLPRH